MIVAFAFALATLAALVAFNATSTGVNPGGLALAALLGGMAVCLALARHTAGRARLLAGASLVVGLAGLALLALAAVAGGLALLGVVGVLVTGACGLAIGGMATAAADIALVAVAAAASGGLAIGAAGQLHYWSWPRG